MATIAEQLIGSALQFSQKGPDALGALKTGSELAATAERIKAQRQQMEQQKQELMLQKADKIMGAVEKGSAFKDKAAQNLFFKNYVPGMVKALKMEEFFTPELMEYVQGSEEVRNKLIGLRLDIQEKINRGELRGAEIFNYAKSRLSPEELPLLDTDSLLEQQKFAASEEGKGYRAELVQTGQGQRQQTQIGSAGQVALAKDVADRFGAYEAGGGKSGLEASLKGLDEAADALESGKVVTGGITTKIPGFRSDSVQSTINPKLVEVRTQAQGALNNVLRATLGAQFTQQEGERVLNQIWDDKLAPQANVKKIRAKIQELRANVKNMEKTFVEQGFLPRLQGQKTAKEAKDAASSPKKKFSDLSPAAQEITINQLAKKTGRPAAEIRAELEAQ